MQWANQSTMRPLEIVKMPGLVDGIIKAGFCQAIRLHTTSQTLFIQ